MNIFSLFSKHKDPRTKYLTKEHWLQLQQDFKLINEGRIEDVIQSGLKYDGNINHPGDAILLFQSFFIADVVQHASLVINLATKFSQQGYFAHFEKVDEEYLLGLTAMILRHPNLYESTKNHPIHTKAKVQLITKGVNPALLQLFRIEEV